MKTEDEKAMHELNCELLYALTEKSTEISMEFSSLIEKCIKVEVLDKGHLKLTCDRNEDEIDLLFYVMLILTCFYPTPDKEYVAMNHMAQKYEEGEDFSIIIPTYAQALQDAKEYVRDCVEAGDDINEVTGRIPLELMREVAKELGLKYNH